MLLRLVFASCSVALTLSNLPPQKYKVWWYAGPFSNALRCLILLQRFACNSLLRSSLLHLTFQIVVFLFTYSSYPLGTSMSENKVICPQNEFSARITCSCLSFLTSASVYSGTFTFPVFWHFKIVFFSLNPLKSSAFFWWEFIFRNSRKL